MEKYPIAGFGEMPLATIQAEILKMLGTVSGTGDVSMFEEKVKEFYEKKKSEKSKTGNLPTSPVITGKIFRKEMYESWFGRKLSLTEVVSLEDKLNAKDGNYFSMFIGIISRIGNGNQAVGMPEEADRQASQAQGPIAKKYNGYRKRHPNKGDFANIERGLPPENDD